MSFMIQIMLAAAMTASGLLISAVGKAGMITLAEGVSASATGSDFNLVETHIDLDGTKLSTRVVSRFSSEQVIPEHFFDLSTVSAQGDFSWAGVHEFRDLLDVPTFLPTDLKLTIPTVDAEFGLVDYDHLTAKPAPEPPTSVMAGIALAAGGFWNRLRRRWV
jgi:hypothetical protein